MPQDYKRPLVVVGLDSKTLVDKVDSNQLGTKVRNVCKQLKEMMTLADIVVYTGNSNNVADGLPGSVAYMITEELEHPFDPNKEELPKTTSNQAPEIEPIISSIFEVKVNKDKSEEILGLKTIEKVVKLDSIVVVGGSAKVKQLDDKTVVAVQGQVDELTEVHLLANSLRADGLVLFHDAKEGKKGEFVFYSKDATPGHSCNKSTLAKRFVQEGGQWSAVGSSDNLKNLFLSKDFWAIKQKTRPKQKNVYPLVHKSVSSWKKAEILDWLKEIVALPKSYRDVISSYPIQKILELSQSEIEQMKIPWPIAQELYDSISFLKKQIDEEKLFQEGKRKGNREYQFRFIDSKPYLWPFNGVLNRNNTAIVCIDMQKDFVGGGGYFENMGYDISMSRALIPFIQNIFDVARQKGIHIIHTREGHIPNLADLPANKRWRSEKSDKSECGIGAPAAADSRLLTREQPDWNIIDELAPIAETNTPFHNEIIIDKPGKGSFVATEVSLPNFTLLFFVLNFFNSWT